MMNIEFSYDECNIHFYIKMIDIFEPCFIVRHRRKGKKVTYDMNSSF